MVSKMRALTSDWKAISEHLEDESTGTAGGYSFLRMCAVTVKDRGTAVASAAR